MEKLIENFLEIFDESPSKTISEDLLFKDLEEWDSMMVLSLMAMVDEEYGINLKPDDLKSINSLNELHNFIKSSQ
jgi:acyl carrier protein